MIKLSVKEIIEFYDSGRRIDKNHSSSITGLIGEDLASGLVKHYFENQGYEVSIFIKPIEVIGKKWLDRWIKISKNGKVLFYQTEIKN